MATQGKVTVTWAGIEGVSPIEFAYLEDGPADGPLALCLHGFPDVAQTWDSLLPELAAAGFHAVAPWMRGYAPTPVPPDALYQPGALALDAIALTDALAGPDQPAVVIGHDWGSIAAHAAAAHRPDRFRRLVGLAVPHRAALAARLFMLPTQLKRSWYIYFFQLPLAEMSAGFNDFALIEKLWRDWSPGFEPPAAHLRAVKDTLAADGCLEAALGYYRHLLNPLKQDERLADVEAAATSWVQIPTLYLHGELDDCIGADTFDAEELKGLFPAGLDVEIYPNLGHFLHLEDPTTVNRRIIDFLTA